MTTNPPSDETERLARGLVELGLAHQIPTRHDLPPLCVLCGSALTFGLCRARLQRALSAAEARGAEAERLATFNETVERCAQLVAAGMTAVERTPRDTDRNSALRSAAHAIRALPPAPEREKEA